jgi:putative membrane protein
MYMPAIMAFLHHLAAFTLVGSMMAEFVLFKPPLTVSEARRLQIVDLHFGVSAGVILVVGLLRVFYFEKGAAYYFHDAFFLSKLSAFIVAGLISIYPTKVFLSWGATIRRGVAPEITPLQFQRVRLCLVLEGLAIIVILFCAPFMARGLGYFGH